MKAFAGAVTTTVVLAVGAGALFGASPAVAAVSLPSLVAYVRGGNVFVSKGVAETQLTKDGGIARPRWSADGRSIAFLKGGQLWTMKADGSSRRQLTSRGASGASWAPDSKSLAFASLSCTGGPGVYRVSATAAPTGTPEVLFPSSCRGAAQPRAAVDHPATGTLNERLSTDDAVAFSPDGSKIAFRGGNCEDVYDSCLSIGTIAGGAEKTVAAYGGGSLQNSGFAVVPSWRSDGAKLSFTAFQKGETAAENQPLHLVEYDTVTGAKRNVGSALDREMAYVDAARGVATGRYQQGSWVLIVNLATGGRTAFHSGSQPSVQPQP